ncbi:MAG TPA: hypothetical protein VKY19_14355 [Ktedonosporobacter sp.]|jgi:hypothetical protein|nr:hypothetical protein [Ktedonosporobacter sp.]
MVATTCTFFPEPEDKEPSPLGLAFIPVYRVHSIEQPFCSKPHCFCQEYRPYTSALLESVRRTEVTIQRIPGEGTL